MRWPHQRWWLPQLSIAEAGHEEREDTLRLSTGRPGFRLGHSDSSQDAMYELNRSERRGSGLGLKYLFSRGFKLEVNVLQP